MLAPNKLPEEFISWNRKYGAPSGYERPRRSLFRCFYSNESWLRLRGPFAIQPGNNSTRHFEYPWAFSRANLSSPQNIVEIGGSLAGFQFVLSRLGHKVTNIDPGLNAEGLGWPVNRQTISQLNKLFDTNVCLINTTFDKANLPTESVDIIFSISVLEHLTENEFLTVMKEAFRCLRVGGQFIITLDLFLNLSPFTEAVENSYGTNKSVKQMIEYSGLHLIHGIPKELNGFEEFRPSKILELLDCYMIGSYPVLTQCIVLQKLENT